MSRTSNAIARITARKDDEGDVEVKIAHGRALRSAQRRRVHDSALLSIGRLRPRSSLSGLRAEIALEHLAVVADALHDAHGPAGRDPERLAELVGRAKQALHPDRGCASRATLSRVTPPYSSAVTSMKSTQRTSVSQSSSPSRTTGPSGSLEILSGRITYAPAPAGARREPGRAVRHPTYKRGSARQKNSAQLPASSRPSTGFTPRPGRQSTRPDVGMGRAFLDTDRRVFQPGRRFRRDFSPP